MQKTNSIQKINVVILYILLLIRIFYDFVANWIWHPAPPDYNQIPTWYTYSFIFVGYLLVSIVIWLNQYNLKSLNIDKPFIIIFILAGILISLYYLPPFWSGIAGLLTIITFGLLVSNKFGFGEVALDLWRTIPVFIIGLLPFAILFALMHPLGGNKGDSLGVALFFSNLPVVVIEEVVFRGLLWSYLRDQGFTDSKIIYAQAFLFWLAHLAQNWNQPFMLWFWTVWTAFWLGFLVKRSKSLTPSVIGHFLANLFSLLIGR